ncbi:MAG: DUF4157 domain-containing protein [Acidobacteriota bacterium]|nr:DUF4157 domain-containing protein [Acidobacteriota bacterium]
MSKKPDLYQTVTVTISKQQKIDEAAVRAVLAKLGLKTEAQLKQFSAQNNYADIVAYFLQYIHFGNNYTGISKAARITGQVTVPIYVSVVIVNQIKSFLGQVAQAVKTRVADAALQANTGLIEAGSGVSKNLAESFKNIDHGGGQTLHGTFNAMTAPVSSERYYKGWNDLSEGLVEFGKGIGKLFIQTPADDLVMLGSREISAWQTLLTLEAIGRPLNASEKQILTSVFGSSVEYDAIRIKEGYAFIWNAGLDNGITLRNNQRAITFGNTIYMKNSIPGTPPFLSTLVHETTHVWQNQNGGTDYMLEALYAQSPLGGGYGYYEDVTKNNKNWAMLSPEQQGQLIQDAYGAGYFTNYIWSGDAFLTQYMNQVLPQLRAGQGAT